MGTPEFNLDQIEHALDAIERDFMTSGGVNLMAMERFQPKLFATWRMLREQRRTALKALPQGGIKDAAR